MICANDQTLTSVKVQGTQESIMQTGGAQVIWQNVTQNEIIFVFENNSAIALGSKKGIFYPPPKSKPISRIYPSPFQEGIYYLLLQDGALARVRMQDETGVFETGVKSGEIFDIQNHQVNASIEVDQLLQLPIQKTIVFLKHLKPPHFDAEITTKQLSKLKGNEQGELKKEEIKKDLMCFGMSNGTIIFVDKENMKNIYTRLSFHREKITHVCELYKDEQVFLVSLDAEYLLKLTYFEKNRPFQLITINTSNCINNLTHQNHYLFIGSKRGDLQVFKLNKKNQLGCNINNEGNDHDGPIIGLQLFKQKLILTAGQDERIKLWTYRKILLVQILLEQDIKAIGLIEYTQLYIVFENQISKVTKEAFYYKDEFIKEVNQKMKLVRQLPYLLEDYCMNFNNLQKFKQKVQFPGEEEIHNQSPKQIIRKQSMLQSQNTELESKSDNLEQSIQQQDFNNNFDLKLMRKSRLQSRQSRGTTADQKNLSYYQQQQVNQAPEKKQEDTFAIISRYENNKFKFRSNLPALPSTQDYEKKSRIEQFTQDRLIKNRIQTRRDITMNRIILKNLLKQELNENTIKDLMAKKKLRSVSNSFYY